MVHSKYSPTFRRNRQAVNVAKGLDSAIAIAIFNHRGRSGRSHSPVMEPIWLLAQCILGKFLGVVCHCFPPPLDVPTLAATCLCVRSDAKDPSSEGWNCGREGCPVVILPKFRLPRKFRDLLHAANLRHGTDGFASPPREGVLRIFFTLKIRGLRPGLNPRTWVPKANTLPVSQRSRYIYKTLEYFN